MLKVENLSFKYDSEPILSNINFSLDKGEHLSIIGESGCGKSTLLKIIYGLLHIEEGEISWNGKRLLGPHYNIIPGESFIKYVAQDYDLMPFISVAENVGKYLSNFYPEEKAERIAELLEVVEMTAFANVKPKYLSGGQKQRVALARALALEPEILLLDEPFSNIDNFRKNSLRRNLFSYFRKKNISCIVATHDREDSLSFSDKTIVINNGRIVADASPFEIYNSPKERHIAALFGEVNELPAELFLPAMDQNVLLYPHEIRPARISGLKATIEESYYKGNYYLIRSKFREHTIYFQSRYSLKPKETVFLTASKELIKRRLK